MQDAQERIRGMAHLLFLMGGSGEFKECFPKEAIFKLKQPRWWTDTVPFQRKSVAPVPHQTDNPGQEKQPGWFPGTQVLSGDMFQSATFVATREVSCTNLDCVDTDCSSPPTDNLEPQATRPWLGKTLGYRLRLEVIDPSSPQNCKTPK